MVQLEARDRFKFRNLKPAACDETGGLGGEVEGGWDGQKVCSVPVKVPKVRTGVGAVPWKP